MNVIWKNITKQTQAKDIPFLVHKQLAEDRQTKQLEGKKVCLLLNMNKEPASEELDYLATVLKTVLDELRASDCFVLCDLYYPTVDPILSSISPTVKYMQLEHFLKLPKKLPPLQFSFFGTPKKGKFLSQRYLPKSLMESDYIIPITILGSDAIFDFHGTLASLFWVLPSYTRNEILIQENYQLRCLSFLEIASQITSKVHCAINLNTSFEKHFLVTSQNVISADAVASYLFGTPVSKNKLLVYADKKGFGNSIVSRLMIYGDKLEKPTNPIETYGENYSIGIQKDICTLCGDCETFCPLHAMYIKEDHLFWNPADCTHCGYCISICPEEALIKRRK